MRVEKTRRNTQQRRVILEELRKLTSHPTAAELYEIARRRLPKLSLGTVYRNLELLTELGEINKLQTGGGQARYDGDLNGHYHVRCQRCGRIDDAYEVRADPLGRDEPSIAGYRIMGYHLEYVGLCPDCMGASVGQAEVPVTKDEG